MGLFDLFKKKDDGVPDVGKEVSDEPVEKSDSSFDAPAQDESEQDEAEEAEEKDQGFSNPMRGRKGKKGTKGAGREAEYAPVKNNFEVEKLTAKVAGLNELVKGYSERFSTISQQIGEVRAMTLTNEKAISKSSQNSEMAVDIVKEVKPEKLRMEYQKIDARIAAFEEKVELNKQFMDTIMNELKELRRKSGLFIGTDAILSLNEDIKKDLLEAHKLASIARVHADKSEQIFIELKKGFAESQRVNEIVLRFEASYSGMNKQIEKLKLDYSNIVNSSELEDYKKNFNGRLVVMENAVANAEKIKENDERLSRIIETLVAMAKKNKEDIADIAATIGDEKIDRIGDYENQLASILTIIDNLANQISEIKGRKHAHSDKDIEHLKKIRESLKLKKHHHLRHPHNLAHPVHHYISKKRSVPAKIKKIQEGKEKNEIEKEMDKNMGSLKKHKSHEHHGHHEKAKEKTHEPREHHKHPEVKKAHKHHGHHVRPVRHEKSKEKTNEKEKFKKEREIAEKISEKEK